VQITQSNVATDFDKVEHLAIYPLSVVGQLDKRRIPTPIATVNEGADLVDGFLDCHVLVREDRDQVVIDAEFLHWGEGY